MSINAAIHQSLESFKKDYPDPKRVGFLMMSFEERGYHSDLIKNLKDCFRKENIEILRADDKEYHHDLFCNIQTYIHGCGFGVAIFDKVGAKDFNPNVSLEVGYMLSLNKEILFLKNRDLETLSTDLMGKLHKNFNTYKIKETVPPQVANWISDKEFRFSKFKFYVKLSIKTMEVASNQSLTDYNPCDSKAVMLGMLPTASKDEAIFIFQGDIQFYDLCKRYHANDILNLRVKSIEVLAISDKPEIDSKHEVLDFINGKALKSDQRGMKYWSWQICRAPSWNGDSNIIYKGKNIVGEKKAFKVNDAKVYISISNDNYVVLISNLINFGASNASKLRSPLWLKPDYKMRLIDAFHSIAAFDDLSIKPTTDQVIISHYKHVKYYVDTSCISEINEIVDFCGALNVEAV